MNFNRLNFLVNFKIILSMQTKLSTLKDFQIISKLGEGSFGQVFKVKRKVDDKQYAMKKIRIGSMKTKDKENALNQVRILASYNHEFIIGFKDAFFDQISETLCVVMEFAEGGDILKLNQIHVKSHTNYPEQTIWRALVHVTSGLKSLHNQKILHRDLKCANVFVTADRLYKLGDLNVSKVLKKDYACTQTGTPYYASPEVWKDKPYGVKSDMWSLGCVLYQMAALHPPFMARDLQGLYKKVCLGVFQRIPNIYSNDLQTAISSLLRLDPNKRPTTQELLSNPTVQKHYNGEILIESKDSGDGLLKTIKYNPRDLKGLKKILPKAQYIEQEENQPPQSCKIIRKKSEQEEQAKISKANPLEAQIKQLLVNDDKLQEFLQKKRQKIAKQRADLQNVIRQQQNSLSKKKDRVLSACKPVSKNVCQSPRNAIKEHLPKLEPPNTCKPQRKDQSSNKLPPKPPVPVHKLPPKPVQNIPSQKKIPIPRSVEESPQRDSSKQNLRNIGARIVNESKPDIPRNQSKVITPRANRCSSAQKVVYPNWWN